MADDGDWFWPLAGAALLAWFAYDKWWKEDVPKAPPAPSQVYEPLPDEPLVTLDDGTVWHMIWNKVSGPRAKRLAWVRADHSNNKKVKARQTLTLFMINCDTSGYRTLSIFDYDKDGKVLNIWGEKEFGEDYSYAPPESNIENVVEGACMSRFDPAPIPPPVTTNKPQPQ